MSGHLPLTDLRVVDHTDLRGALCARLLADLGADVARIPHRDDDGEAGDRFRNARKRVAELDPESAEWRQLLDRADVYIENLGPGADLDRDGLLTAHPQLIHVSLSDFGLTGPRADWRLEPLPALAASGALFATGFPLLPPTAPPGYVAHDCASVHGALGAVAAIMERRRCGLGQRVEISVQEAALTGLIPWPVSIPDYLSVNPLLPVEGTRNAEGLFHVMPAADGYVRLVITTGRDWDNLVTLLGSPEELSGPEWKDLQYRGMNNDVVRDVCGRILGRRTRADIFAHAMELALPLGLVQTPLEFVAHPQCDAREFFHDGMAVTPWKLSSADHEPPTPPRPVGDRLDWPSRPPVTADRRTGLLLDCVRVIEFGMAAVVPEMSWMLSELGADVIRIESSRKMDALRFTGLGQVNKAYAFNCASRGRRSVTIDMTTDEGKRLALELCRDADVIAENNRGGMMARLGLDYDDIRAINPSVIYAASQGYGRGGPMGEMRAYGPLNSCFSGVHLLFSHPDGPYPSGTSMNHPDHVASKLLAVAVLAALDHRDRSGEGQLVDMAQTEAAVYLLGELYLEGIETGVEPRNLANRHPSMAPHGVYPSAGEDEWIAIAVADDAAWAALENVCGWESEPAWTTSAGRLAARDDIDARLSAWTETLPADDATALLQAVGVSALTVMGPLHHLGDAHLNERGFVDELVHEEFGIEHHVRNPTRFTRTELRTAASAPCLGAHTEEVLDEVLGLSPIEINGLKAAGILR